MKNSIYFYCLLFLIFCTVGCAKQDDGPCAHSAITKLAPYLYEVTFTEYDPGKVETFFNTLDKSVHGAACSAVRNGNFIGRNLDYFYDETAEFVIHVPAAAGRYASVGVSSCNFFLTAEIVESGKESPYLAMIPYFTTDGVNDQGVYVSINMAPTGDLGYTTGTNPGAETLCCSMVVRYVLDNCKTAAEACEKLSKMNITTVGLMGEFHYLIADKNDTYIAEIINNKLVYSKDAGNIITNYYLLHNGYTPHAQGTERYDILKEHYAEGATFDGMDALLKRVQYSQAYDPKLPNPWYSDFCGFEWEGQSITIDTPHNVTIGLIEKMHNGFATKERNMLGGYWITIHQSVYDISAKRLRVYVQENYSKSFEFIL